MLGRLFLLFTVTTTVELILLLLLSRALSIPFTAALIVLTGLLGAYLASREGRRAWRRVSESLTRGELPADPIVQALLVLAGGLLLLTPGLLTDLTGFACLIPPSRAWLSRRVRAVLARRTGIAPLADEPAPAPERTPDEPPRRRGVVDVTDQQ